MLKNIESRILTIFFIITGVVHTLLIITDMNTEYPLFSIAFFVLHFLIILVFLVHVINNWTLYIPKRRVLKEGFEKNVAVFIPTWNEPVHMVRNTVISVVEQDYENSKLTIVLSDDSHNPAMKSMLKSVSDRYSGIRFIYNEPPTKDDPNRKGEGKSGNLNSALDLILRLPDLDVDYIETRDADDLVGSRLFLRDTIGQLVSDKSLGFVQTIKTVKHSPGDPFANKEELFYKALMLGKNKSNGVFPCGSGVVWRLEALLDIGGFPTWNLVEDFQSGAEAVRKGWKGLYVPILGTVSQTSPEDIPNYFKQRGTWAMDSLRYLFWGDMTGMSFRQKLMFSEPGMFYLLSVISYFLAYIPGLALLANIVPVSFQDPTAFTLVYATFFLSMTLYPFALARKGNVSFISVIRSIQMFYGLGPIYVKALLITLFNGPDKKPVYKVTKKENKSGIYLHYVIPQLFLFGFLIFALGNHAWKIYSEGIALNFISIYWALYFVFMNSRVIRNSWHKSTIL